MDNFLLEFNTPKLKYLSYKHGKIAYRDTGDGPITVQRLANAKDKPNVGFLFTR